MHKQEQSQQSRWCWNPRHTFLDKNRDEMQFPSQIQMQIYIQMFFLCTESLFLKTQIFIALSDVYQYLMLICTKNEPFSKHAKHKLKSQKCVSPNMILLQHNTENQCGQIQQYVLIDLFGLLLNMYTVITDLEPRQVFRNIWARLKPGILCKQVN